MVQEKRNSWVRVQCNSGLQLSYVYPIRMLGMWISISYMNDGRNRGLDIRERKQREDDCVNWNQSRKAILNLQACYPGRTLEVRDMPSNKHDLPECGLDSRLSTRAAFH